MPRDRVQQFDASDSDGKTFTGIEPVASLTMSIHRRSSNAGSLEQLEKV